MFFGSHLSIANGFYAAARQAAELGGNTFQFFTRNPRGGKAKALEEKDLAKSKALRAEKGFGPLLAHAPYTINMASPNEQTFRFAVETLQDDLRRIDAIGAPFIAVHPGSHVGQGEEYAIRRIAEALNEILTQPAEGLLLLEVMAGEGSEMGYRFEQIARIISMVDQNHRLGVCLDSCHLYGAGYDVKDNLEGVLEELDQTIGLSRVKAFHLNDTMHPLASRRDRHADLGEGYLGLEALARIVNHPKLKHLPFLLETPGGLDIYAQQIAWLKSVSDN